MFKKLLFIVVCVLSFKSVAQINGAVIDTNNQPLAFVNVYLENTFTGTTTNSDGIYELNITKPDTYTIVFQFLGYKTIKKTVTIERFPYTLDATMAEEQISLNEVVISSEENPANSIIRKTIDSRKQNLEKINAFTANFYSRGLIRIKNAPEKILGQDIGDLGGGLDSTRSGIIYLSETISKIDFLRPDKLKEQIVASKVSGDDNGFSFNTASDVDYNFYENTIELGNQIISPIADYAFNYYRYKLEGTFYDERGNLINKITVIPRRVNDRIFAGTIYIVEDQWTIYALEMNITGEQAQIPPADVITINQNFSYSDSDALWVLRSQSIDFNYGIFGIKGDGRFTAVYNDYVFNPQFTKKTFGKEILSFANEANKKDSTFWQAVRPVPLTSEEMNDYLKKDSIQIIRKSEKYLDSMDAKGNKFKIFSVLTGYSYKNSYEDWSAGFSSPLSDAAFNTVQGLSANFKTFYRRNIDEFKRYYTFNTNLNYGLEDKRIRATASFVYKFNNIKRPFLSLSGGVTTEQFNESQPIMPMINSISSLFFENNFMKIYDKSFAQVGYSQEITNGLNMFSSVSYERRKPLFNISDRVFVNDDDKIYTSNNPLDPAAFGIAPFETHHIMKLNVNASINFGQEYMSYPDGKFNVPPDKYPTLIFGYEKGFAATNDDYNFDQLKARITQRFNIGNKGDFVYNFKAGTFFNADDIAFMDYYHPNGNQTHIGTSGSYLNVFNNLPYYAMSTNSSYAEFHAEHDFKGYLLSKVPLLNKLKLNLVVGAHSLMTEENKPYQEFSVGLDNIGFKKFRFLRLDYLRSYQNGYQGDAIVFGLKFLNFFN